MALGDNYATTAELKSYAGIATADTADDTKVADALSAASRGIDHFCHRQFNNTSTASARVFHPRHCGLVEVDDFHTVVDLVVKTDSGNDGTYETTVAAANYQLEPLNGVLDGESGWPYFRIVAVDMSFPTRRQRPAVEVTAKWGWAGVPGPVKMACLLLANEALKLAREAPFGVAGFGAFGAVRVRDNPRAAAMLSPYVRDLVLVG